MFRRLKPVGLGLLLALAVVGCADNGNDFFGPEDHVLRPGILVHYGDTAEVSVPSTVTAGEEFTVTVETFGGGCDGKDGTEVEAVEGAVEITPIDNFYVGDGVCLAILKVFTHTAEWTFDEAGEQTVRIRGRKVSRDVDEAIVLTRTVTVKTSDGA